MAVSRTLRRLLGVRNLEEQQCRMALEAAVSELRHIEHAIGFAVAQKRHGRRLVLASTVSGDAVDRLAGLEEAEVGERRRRTLASRRMQAEAETDALRQVFLERRVERRQAETLIEEAMARDAIEGDRRAQQGQDDWYGAQLFREAMAAKRRGEDDAASQIGGDQ